MHALTILKSLSVVFALIVCTWCITLVIPILVIARRVNKAMHILHAYNRWVVDELGQPELIIPETEVLVSGFTSWYVVFFESVWDLFPDQDVRNSLKAFWQA